MSHPEKEPNPNLSDQVLAAGATATGTTLGAGVSQTVGGMESAVAVIPSIPKRVGIGAKPVVVITLPRSTAYGAIPRADGGASVVVGRTVAGTAVGVTMTPTSGISMSNSPTAMTTPHSAVTTQPLTHEQFQQLRQKYQEILDIKDRQLQIKEETIGACRQEIDYLRNMVDELLKQPTLAELVGIADQIKANLGQSQTPMNP